MIDEIPAHPVCSELDSLPTLDELLRRLNAGKVGGKTGILLELLKYGGTELQDRLLHLMQDVGARLCGQ